ncbi:YcnI family protein, partial [Kibdelosporangium lantanae]
PPAAAHVTVHSDEAVQGAHAEIAFRVPTESATASTVKLRIALPPLEGVSVRTHPGWTDTVTTTAIQPAAQHAGHTAETTTVSEVEWTAGPGAAIGPGEYDSFVITAGPLPATDELVFKAVQTYDNGEVVRWIDLPAATSAGEPEHPAPVLTFTPPPTITAAPATTPLVWWAVGAAGLALLFALGAIGLLVLRRR